MNSPTLWRLATAAVLLTTVGCSTMDHGQHGTTETANGASAEIDHAEMDHGTEDSAVASTDGDPAPHNHDSHDHSDGHGGHGEGGHGEGGHGEGGHGEGGHGEGGHGTDGHDHPPLVVPADQPAPSVAITVTPDPVNGWNLELQTSNFEFAPERVNGESTFDEGHAHLFINGEKRGRLYSNWYHLTDLAPGENLIRVTLNSNGHEEFIVEDEVVADEVVVTVP